jgi:hypothetical protein
MKSKLIRFIVAGLLVVLAITSIFTYNKYQSNMKALKQNINSKSQTEQTYKIVDKDVIIQTLNKENSMNVLKGTVSVQATYSDKNISGDDVSMRWLKNMFADMNSKDLTVDYTYDYMFSYDLKYLPVKVINNTVEITINPNRLSLCKCELSQANSKDRIGILATKFNSQQVNSINGRTRDLAFNRVQSDEDIRYRAFEELKGNIKDLIKPLVHQDTSIVFNDFTYDVVQQSDCTIK